VLLAVTVLTRPAAAQLEYRRLELDVVREHNLARTKGHRKNKLRFRYVRKVVSVNQKSRGDDRACYRRARTRYSGTRQPSPAASSSQREGSGTGIALVVSD